MVLVRYRTLQYLSLVQTAIVCALYVVLRERQHAGSTNARSSADLKPGMPYRRTDDNVRSRIGTYEVIICDFDQVIVCAGHIGDLHTVKRSGQRLRSEFLFTISCSCMFGLDSAAVLRTSYF